MNHLITKIFLLFAVMAFSAGVQAQSYIFENKNQNLAYSGGSTVESDNETEDYYNNSSNTNERTESNSDAVDFNSVEVQVAPERNPAPSPSAARPGAIVVGSATMHTTDAPPDCPECVPDPGGDVPDVPFDKNMLVLLFAGALIIFTKVNMMKKH